MDGSNVTTAHAITVDAAELRRALAFALNVIPRRTTIPVLGMVRLSGMPEHLKLTSTDLDTILDTKVPAEVEGKHFAAMIDPRKLAGLIRFHDGPVRIEYQDEGGMTNTIQITIGDMKARIRELCPATDFPEHSTDGYSTPITIGQRELHNALTAVQPHISYEETRYYLNGIFMEPVAGKLRTVATDGHRLGRYDADFEWPLPKLILPRATSHVLTRNMAKSNGEVKVSHIVDQSEHVKWLSINAGDWRLRTKTIDGTFPDYSRVIPPEADVIDVTLTHAALRRIPYIPGFHPHARIDGDGGTISHTTPDGDTFEMPITGKGPAFGVNLRYLLDMTARGGTIRLMGARQGDPFRVLTDDPALLQIIMPVRL